MLCLPALIDGSTGAALPLADATAAAIAQALLDNDPQACRATLASTMRLDPALTLWAAYRAGSDDRRSSASVQQIADWLAAHALDVLLWGDDSSHEPMPAQKAWAESAARGAIVAAFCRELGDTQAELSALLLEATSQLDQTDVSAFPPWLVAKPTESPMAQVVAEAQRLTRDEPDRLIEIDGQTAEIRRHQRQLQRRWLAACPAAGSLLPLLVTRLRHARQLESRFARELETEKLAAMKQLAYGAGHEINNPLANISTRAQTLMHDETDPERRRRLATINSQAFRAHEMIADMMLFASPPPLHVEPTDLTALVERVVAELIEQAEQQQTALRIAAPAEAVAANIDPVQVAAALRAMIINACEAIGHGGSVEIVVRSVEPVDRAASGVEIVVTDTGPGIAPEVRRHLFDPFYSGREAGRGLGFGLSKAWRIVSEHGGRIDVDNAPQHGAVFRIWLPRRVALSTDRQVQGTAQK